MIVAHIRANHRQYGKRASVARWLLSGIAVMLGFVGFGGFGGLVLPHSTAEFVHSVQLVLNAWYNAIGLLVLRLPKDFEKLDLPWSLQIARLLLPAMAIWVSIRAYLRVTQRGLRFLSLFGLADHLIVTGPGERAQIIARLAKAEDERGSVVYVTDREDHAVLADLHSAGVVILRAQLAERDTYHRANLKRARAIILAGNGSMDNISACETIRRVALDQRPFELDALSVVVAIDSPEMATVLDVSLNQARDERIEYRLLDSQDNIARGRPCHIFEGFSNRIW
ncbi:MAG: NAD-binding protein [Alphaproteobacteria bacterium]|nr:NAD-binding protein [Alphaproteobacteria bacterium]